MLQLFQAVKSSLGMKHAAERCDHVGDIDSHCRYHTELFLQGGLLALLSSHYGGKTDVDWAPCTVLLVIGCDGGWEELRWARRAAGDWPRLQPGARPAGSVRCSTTSSLPTPFPLDGRHGQRLYRRSLPLPLLSFPTVSVLILPAFPFFTRFALFPVLLHRWLVQSELALPLLTSVSIVAIVWNKIAFFCTSVPSLIEENIYHIILHQLVCASHKAESSTTLHAR